MASLDRDVSWNNPSIQGDMVISSLYAVDDDAENAETSQSSGRTHRCPSVSFETEDVVNMFSETERLVGRNYRSGLLTNISRNNDIASGIENSTSSSGHHCHGEQQERLIDKKARKRLVIASLLCLIFMVGEITGGLIAHSLAIISDAAHLLTDFASFMISLLALYLGTRRATKKLSFGWYRAEVLGALVSILVLWVLTGILFYSAVLRVISSDFTIEAEVMLITAATGVAFNLLLGVTLHQHSHGHSHGGGGHGHGSHITSQSRYGSIVEDDQNKEKNHSEPNINVKAAFIHVIGDLLQSIGVLIAAFIIYFKPEWKIADPICTFLFSVFVLFTTITILRDILLVLMEGTPKNINFGEVRDTFFEIQGVKDIHNLRVWSLTLNKTALSVHIAVDKDAEPLKVIKIASYIIQTKYGITETTMQIEEYVEEMLDCTQCQDLKD